MNKTIALLNCHGDDVFCFRREIINALIEKGNKIILSCPDSHRLDIFRNNKSIIIEDVEIDRRGTNPLKDLKLTLAYIKLFKKYRPDIVCTFTIKPNIYGSIAADIFKIPHINNITGLGSGFQNSGFVLKVAKKLYRIALKKSILVLFQNKENESIAIEAGMIGDNLQHKCIPGSGVNLEHFVCTLKEENENLVVFNYIGRILHDKRIDDYLEAAQQIKKKHVSVQFNVIGFIESTEKHYKKLLKDLEQQNIIHYCGNVDDVRPFIQKSDATIHPSSYGEGMSNVLLETAATGRAIITTDISGCKEIVDDGISGFIYKAEDVAQLVTKIEKFLSISKSERAKMGLNGRKKVELYFNRNIVVNEYLEAIEHV